jgi:hypothetical protein
MLVLLIGASGATAQRTATIGHVGTLASVGTAFTYQGRLADGGSSANGTYDFEFELYDTASGGTQVGSTVTKDDVTLTDGLFTVELDFGGVFDGTGLWLNIGVRPGSSTGAYTALTPRQSLTPVPYALALPGLWTQQNTTSPNVIGGYSGNSIPAGVVGATIGGGGQSGFAFDFCASWGYTCTTSEEVPRGFSRALRWRWCCTGMIALMMVCDGVTKILVLNQHQVIDILQ